MFTAMKNSITFGKMAHTVKNAGSRCKNGFRQMGHIRKNAQTLKKLVKLDQRVTPWNTFHSVKKSVTLDELGRICKNGS